MISILIFVASLLLAVAFMFFHPIDGISQIWEISWLKHVHIRMLHQTKGTSIALKLLGATQVGPADFPVTKTRLLIFCQGLSIASALQIFWKIERPHFRCAFENVTDRWLLYSHNSKPETVIDYIVRSSLLSSHSSKPATVIYWIVTPSKSLCTKSWVSFVESIVPLTSDKA